MEGRKLHKESKRIVSAITKAGTPNFTSAVNVGKFTTFETVVEEVARECTETFVMLGAIVDRHLYVAAIVPPDKNDQLAPKWIVDSTAAIDVIPNFTGPSTFVRLGDLEFPEGSSNTPFKAIDQVFGAASAWLRKNDLLPEEEEEHEYGFDDI